MMRAEELDYLPMLSNAVASKGVELQLRWGIAYMLEALKDVKVPSCEVASPWAIVILVRLRALPAKLSVAL